MRNRTGPKNPHRSGLSRDPRPWAESRRAPGEPLPPLLTGGEFCWCGERLSNHPGRLHWSDLPEDLLDVALQATSPERIES